MAKQEKKQEPEARALLQEDRPFAAGLHFYKLFWIFLIGCVVGYVVEMLWCYIKMGYFESRQGLVYGPFSPCLLYTSRCV